MVFAFFEFLGLAKLIETRAKLQSKIASVYRRSFSSASDNNTLPQPSVNSPKCGKSQGEGQPPTAARKWARIKSPHAGLPDLGGKPPAGDPMQPSVKPTLSRGWCNKRATDDTSWAGAGSVRL
jgi:hypothetical protein